MERKGDGKEEVEFGDIVMTSNKEGYGNLPLKTVAMIDNFTQRCQDAQYLV